jgi:phytanoyl-CoA hydroxylase
MNNIKTSLTKEQKLQWTQEGYIIIPNFYSEHEIDAVLNIHDKVWTDKPKHLVVDHLDTGKRSFLKDITDKEQNGRFKVNDLYLDYEEVRHLAMNDRLSNILEELLLEKAVLINSLSLKFGTQQPMHQDSLYMTPPSPYNLAATWIALEDCSEDSGPLTYIPGSHVITPYKFSNGGFSAIDGEMKEWRKYIDDKVKEYGLETKTFLPKKGDLLIWSSYLVHGGGYVTNIEQSRKSIVFHYFNEKDVGHNTNPMHQGFWLNRPHIQINPNKTNITTPSKAKQLNDVLKRTVRDLTSIIKS